VLAGSIYLIHSMVDLLAARLPGSMADILLLIAGVSELSLAGWLLIAGVNPARWQARTDAALSIGE
jgi:hypothetical protein